MGLHSFGIISLHGSVMRPIIGADMRAYEQILVGYRRAKLQAARYWYPSQPAPLACSVPAARSLEVH